MPMLRAPLFKITEGWSEPLDAQLLINGVPFNATGMQLTAVVHDKFGRAVSVSSTLTPAATSVARLLPAGTEFLASRQPYTIHYKVQDGSGKIMLFPQDDPETIDVSEP